MILDVFTCFRKASDSIRSAIEDAYPDNSMDGNKAFRSLGCIEGVITTLTATLESRVDLEVLNKRAEAEAEHSLRRRIDADWSPSENWEPTAAVDSSSDEMPDAHLVVDYYYFLGEFVKTNKNSLEFYKKQGSGAAHATLQRVQASNQMLVAFLNSMNPKK